MSRSHWRCRNPACPTPHGCILGQVTQDGGLVLDPAIVAFAVYLDTHRTEVVCPACRTRRIFSGTFVRRGDR
jgi:hypothetical protein